METKEIWRGINGFRGLYEVSDFGRVRSLPRGPKGRERIIGSDSNSYSKVTLSIGGKSYCKNIHSLVAEAFLPSPSEGKWCVNHIDGNKSNNHSSNLEWVSYRENNIHAYATGLSKRGQEHYETRLTNEAVTEIRRLFNTMSAIDIANKFNLSRSATSAIIQGRTWKHLPVLSYPSRKQKLYKARPDFAEAARAVHGDTYDYSQAKYVRSLVPVTILCPKHGAFEQKPNTHLQGSGCPKCAIARRVALLSKN